MNYSNKLVGYKFDPSFATIMALGYYDGPESGLAVYSSGHGVKFHSLGDSKSRLFRAFMLTSIAGDWREAVAKIRDLTNGEDAKGIILPDGASDVLLKLEEDIELSNELETVVGLGSPYLNCLSTIVPNAEQLQLIKEIDNPYDCFRLVHQFLK